MSVTTTDPRLPRTPGSACRTGSTATSHSELAAQVGLFDRVMPPVRREEASVEVGAAAEGSLQLAEMWVVAEGEHSVPQLDRFLALRCLVDDRPEEAGAARWGETEHRRTDVAAAALQRLGRLRPHDAVVLGGVGGVSQFSGMAE